jgi:flavin-dependent dehydrogenase
VRDKIFDVAVIGAGPAGASAAITAAREGLDVALLESGSFPRHKVCGEFISGEALPLLNSLVVNHELLARAPRIKTARVFLDHRVVTLAVKPAGASLSRHKLDRALWESAIADGVNAQNRVRVMAVRKNESLFSVGSEGAQLFARTVINATGRWSNFSPLRPVAGDNWIGLKQHFLEDESALCCDLYFFREGYCGVQGLGDGIINVAAMVRADVARSLAEVFAQNRELLPRSKNWQPATEAVATSPLLFSQPRTSDQGVALAGDAAAFIDPFAGDGISMALHSGRLAALSLAPYLRGESSLEAALQRYDFAYRDLLQPALKAAARLRLLLRLPKTVRLTALSLLQFPPLARLAVQQTRVRMVA